MEGLRRAGLKRVIIMVADDNQAAVILEAVRLGRDHRGITMGIDL